MKKERFGTIVAKDFRRNKIIYLMLLPVVLYYLVFHYGPMYGVQIAFKEFSPRLGIWGSDWVGIKYFKQFFESQYFLPIIKNTLILSFYDITFGFPAPIVLALLLNEVRLKWFKTSVQTITYLPHFISIVVIVGMMVDFLSTRGMINQLIQLFGGQSISFLQKPEWFRFIYIVSGIWKEVGWGTIIYLAAITTIDPTLYEAAKVDGAGRFKQILHVTFPGITSTIIILFILRIGHVMTVGDEKILLMYNPMTYETADVIGTFVYRKGILEANYSYTAAVGLFNSLINFGFLLLANKISKKYSETNLF